MGAVDDLIEKARKINPATDRRFKNNKGAGNPNAGPKQLGGAMFDRIKAIAQRQSNDEHNSFVARRASHQAAVASTNPKKRGLLKPVMAPDRRNLKGYGGKNPLPAYVHPLIMGKKGNASGAAKRLKHQKDKEALRARVLSLRGR